MNPVVKGRIENRFGPILYVILLRHSEQLSWPGADHSLFSMCLPRVKQTQIMETNQDKHGRSNKQIHQPTEHKTPEASHNVNNTYKYKTRNTLMLIQGCPSLRVCT